MLCANYSLEIPISQRIYQLRRAKGLTQKAFADSLGIVQGYLSGIERGKKIPSYTLLLALRHVYGIDEEWLSGEGGKDWAVKPQSRAHNIENAKKRTPLLKTIPEGFPDQINDEVIGDFICLPGIPEGCFAIVADGDFMAPTIRDGDLVTFKPGGDIGNRSIVLMNNKWGEVILRRCRVREGEVYFSSENSMYAPFQADTNTRIFGTVIDIWRKVKI